MLTKAARRYELHLMARVIPAQRWGVPAGVPDGFTVHVKNGWAPLSPVPGWFVNSIGCFTHADRNYSVVVLTQGNPTMGYGVATVEDVAEVINRGLNPGARHVIPRSRPFPSWGPTSRPGLRPPRPEGRRPSRGERRTVATAARACPGRGRRCLAHGPRRGARRRLRPSRDSRRGR